MAAISDCSGVESRPELRQGQSGMGEKEHPKAGRKEIQGRGKKNLKEVPSNFRSRSHGQARENHQDRELQERLYYQPCVPAKSKRGLTGGRSKNYQDSPSVGHLRCQ